MALLWLQESYIFYDTYNHCFDWGHQGIYLDLIVKLFEVTWNPPPKIGVQLNFDFRKQISFGLSLVL